MVAIIYGLNSLKLYWNKAVYPEGISHYRIYKDNTLHSNTLDNSSEKVINNLTTGIEYSFYVVGITNDDKRTKKSNTITVMLMENNGLNYYLNTDI